MQEFMSDNYESLKKIKDASSIQSLFDNEEDSEEEVNVDPADQHEGDETMDKTKTNIISSSEEESEDEGGHEEEEA